MTRTLIPRVGGKVVESQDFEKYWDPIINDYIECGLAISAQCPNVLAVNIASGNGRINGLYFENTATCNVMCLTACSTNYILVNLTRDCMCRPSGFTFTASTMCCVTADQMLLASAVTNATTVTSVCNSLADTDPLVTLKNKKYGDGNDGAGCNPTAPTIPVQEYTNLTFTCNTTWCVPDKSPLLIKVNGTLSISMCVTWTINTDTGVRSSGGADAAGGNGGVGGDAATVIIMANSVCAGTSAVIDVSPINAGANGGTGGSGNTVGEFGYQCTVERVGSVSKVAHKSAGKPGIPSCAASPIGGLAGDGGTGSTINNVECHIRTFCDILLIHGSGGAGGGEGGSSTGTGSPSGGGGGAGGSALIASGGNGGQSEGGNMCISGSGGGGGGGGASSVFVFVTCMMDNDLTLQSTGTAGGNGGAGTCSCMCTCFAGDGGGGGGGAASIIYIAPSACMCTGTLTATGGSGGTSTGGTNGSVGGSATQFIDISSITTSNL